MEITGTKGRLICDENGLTYDRLKEDERIWCATCKEGLSLIHISMMETFRTYCSIDAYGRLNVLSSTQIVFHLSLIHIS